MSAAELIAALEAATGPSRELDEAIDQLAFENQWRAERFMMTDSTPAYTYSLDAALTLVPEGYWWAAGDCKRESHASVGLEGGSNDTIYDTSGATPPNVAIAICIAALKARRESV